MNARCKYPCTLGYHNYGGRGIRVCEEWVCSFAAFESWAKEAGAVAGLTLDRIDVNGNYEPSNCRWITMTEQHRNRRNNRMVTIFGETKTMVEWTEDERCATTRASFRDRLERGWKPEEALTVPVAHNKHPIRLAA